MVGYQHKQECLQHLCHVPKFSDGGLGNAHANHRIIQQKGASCILKNVITKSIVPLLAFSFSIAL
jgi:hypothetical protein